jgi:hypothetical protein
MLRIVFLLCLLSSKIGFSTLIHQSSWDEILNGAQHVLKVKVLNSNHFAAKVIVSDSYAGEFEHQSIWIYSSALTENVGDEFLVFLSDTLQDMLKYSWRQEHFDHWNKMDTLEMKQAIENHQLYYAFGQIGAFPLEKDKISVDLTNPYIRDLNSLRNLPEFEEFLTAIYHTEIDPTAFHQKIISTLKTVALPKDLTYYLNMLAYSKNKIWDDDFEDLSEFNDFELQKALISTLAQIEHKKANEILIKYFKQADPQLTSRALIEIISAKNTEIAPYMLSLLDSTIQLNNDLYVSEKPTNTSEIKGLLYYFKNIPYKPAVPVLHKLIKVKNIDILERTIIALELNEDRTYIDLLKKYIENDSLDNLNICSLTLKAKKYELTALFPALRVACYSNEAGPYTDLTSDILLKQNKLETEPLFIEQFRRLVSNHNYLQPHRYGQVFQKYTNLCYKHDIGSATKIVYDAYKEYTGYGYEFRENPGLFTRKKEIQDSLIKATKKQLGDHNYRDFQIYVRMTSESSFEHYITVYYGNFSRRTDRDSIHNILRNSRKICNELLVDLPFDKIETSTLDRQNTSFDKTFYHAIKRNEGRVLTGFYSYLIDFGDKTDLKFLKNMNKAEPEFITGCSSWEIDEVCDLLKQELKSK